MALLGLLLDVLIFQSLLSGSICHAGNVSVAIFVPSSTGVSVLVTPAEHPIVRGVGETLTLTCTLLPAIPRSQHNASTHSNSSSTSSHTQLLHQIMGHMAHTLTMEEEDEDREKGEEGAPLLRWIMPINAPERVREERLGGSAVSGVTSVRVVVRELRETDSGNYTCELPHHQRAAVAELHVMHRDVVQQCGLQSFQCSTGECIPQRFVCDAKPDCPHKTDELPAQCGHDVCSGKLKCGNGRCLDPVRCCRPLLPAPHIPALPLPHPANCSINPAIRCCRKLMHPAVLDQDLYYLATRPRPHQARRPNAGAPPSPLLIGSLVAVANIATVCLVLVLRQRFWQHGVGTSPHQTFSVTRRSLAWWRDGGSGPIWGLFSRQRSHCSQRRPPPPRASGDIISMTTLSAGPLPAPACGGGVISPPQFCHVPPASTPPPSYQAVCGPPPPYTSEPAPTSHSTVYLPLLSVPDTGFSAVMATSAAGAPRPPQQQTHVNVPLHQISPSHLRLLLQNASGTPHQQVQCNHGRSHDDSDALDCSSRPSANCYHEGSVNTICSGHQNPSAVARRDSCRHNLSKSGSASSATSRGAAEGRPPQRTGSAARDARLSRLLQNSSSTASAAERKTILSRMSSRQLMNEAALEPLLHPPCLDRSQHCTDAAGRSQPRDQPDGSSRAVAGPIFNETEARHSDMSRNKSCRSTNSVIAGKRANKDTADNLTGIAFKDGSSVVNSNRNNSSTLGIAVSQSSNNIVDPGISGEAVNKLNVIEPSTSGPTLAGDRCSEASNLEGPAPNTAMAPRCGQKRSPRTATVHTSFRRSRTRDPLPAPVRLSATLPTPRRHHPRPDSPSSTSSSSTCLAPSSDSLCSFSSSSSSSSS